MAGWRDGLRSEVESRANARTKTFQACLSRDIGGLDETIEEIKEIAIVPLLHPEVYQRAGQDPPKGILLYRTSRCWKDSTCQGANEKHNAISCSSMA